MDTHQENKAGEVKEREGDGMAAIVYMKAGMPAQAARVIATRDVWLLSQSLVSFENCLIDLISNQFCGWITYNTIQQSLSSISLSKDSVRDSLSARSSKTVEPKQTAKERI